MLMQLVYAYSLCLPAIIAKAAYHDSNEMFHIHYHKVVSIMIGNPGIILQ